MICELGTYKTGSVKSNKIYYTFYNMQNSTLLSKQISELSHDQEWIFTCLYKSCTVHLWLVSYPLFFVHRPNPSDGFELDDVMLMMKAF